MKGNVDLNFNNKFFKQQEGSLDFKEKNYGFKRFNGEILKKKKQLSFKSYCIELNHEIIILGSFSQKFSKGIF